MLTLIIGLWVVALAGAIVAIRWIASHWQIPSRIEILTMVLTALLVLIQILKTIFFSPGAWISWKMAYLTWKATVVGG